MNINKLMITIILILVALIIYQIIKQTTLKQCPKPHVEYKYVPRSFRDEQEEPVSIEEIFNKMFAKPSPWMMSRGIGLTDRRNTSLIGREFRAKFI